MVVQFILALLAGILSVMIGLHAFRQFERRYLSPLSQGAEPDLKVQPMAFLFRHQQLVDATPPARALLDILPGENDWQRLMAWISMRIPEVPSIPSLLEQDGRAELGGRQPDGGRGLHVLAEDLGADLTRVVLSDPKSEQAGTVIDSLTLSAIEEELGMLRDALDHSPMLAWREEGNGTISWANAAYIQLAEHRDRGSNCWPLPRLIDLSNVPTTTRRAMVEDGQRSLWFECYNRKIGDQQVAIALPADAAVCAERSLREFVQTLTKTFADLPIGLAIFDKGRSLQLFNPALIDLTGLSAEFLTARPTLYSFLDRLREARMVPEPKDYRSWRNQMSSLENAASTGHHVETWSLPGGQTYRVTGRPHPDGAVAFLLEDITSEVSLTRKFRADLSLSKEVLDSLGDAIAVFNGNGQLATVNSVYQNLWDAKMGGGLIDHITQWHTLAGDGPGLQALRQTVENARLNVSSRDGLDGAMRGPDGSLLGWSVRFLMGGKIVVRFERAPTMVASSPNLPAADSTPAPTIAPMTATA